MKFHLPVVAQATAALCAAVMIHVLALEGMDHVVWEKHFRSPAGTANAPAAESRLMSLHLDFFPQAARVEPDPMDPLMDIPCDHAMSHGATKPAAAGQEVSACLAALLWFERHQLPDGGWADDAGAESKSSSQNTTRTSRVRETSLALLAFLGDGATHLTRYVDADSVSERRWCRGETVKNALKWMMRRTAAELRAMTSEELALGTLALAETCYLTNGTIFRTTTQAWLDALLRTHAGGLAWHRRPGGIVRDAATSTWALLAVGAARAACLQVPDHALRDTSDLIALDRSLPPVDRAALATSGRLLSGEPGLRLGWENAFSPLETLADDAINLPLETRHWAMLATSLARNRDSRTFKKWQWEVLRPLEFSQQGQDAGSAAGSWNPSAGGRLGRTGTTALNTLTLQYATRIVLLRPRATK